MTRRHFEALADALAAVRPDPTHLAERDQWERDVSSVADMLATSNPRFDRERFVRACETR